jgi:hypothetical protein
MVEPLNAQDRYPQDSYDRMETRPAMTLIHCMSHSATSDKLTDQGYGSCRSTLSSRTIRMLSNCCVYSAACYRDVLVNIRCQAMARDWTLMISSTVRTTPTRTHQNPDSSRASRTLNSHCDESLRGIYARLHQVSRGTTLSIPIPPSASSRLHDLASGYNMGDRIPRRISKAYLWGFSNKPFKDDKPPARQSSLGKMVSRPAE